MASSSKLFTTGLMEKVSAEVISGSSASGHGIEFAFDFNPDTYWKISGTGTFVIDVDMGQTITPDDFAIFWHDYNTDHDSGTQAINVYTDDNDDGNYTATTLWWTGSAVDLNNTVGDPIDFPLSGVTLASRTKRYWRIGFGNMTQAIEISQFFFLKTREVSVGNQWPENDEDDYETRLVKAGGGRQLVRLLNRNQTGRFTRQFLFNGDTDYDALRNAFADSKKNTWPLILQEGSTNTLVRFASKPFKKRQLEYQQYNPTVLFERVPYIEDGENY